VEVTNLGMEGLQIGIGRTRKRAVRDLWMPSRGNGCMSNSQPTMRSILSRRIPLGSPFVFVSRCEETALPLEPTSPFGEYTFYPTKPDNEITAVDNGFSSIRPSLPHIYNELPVPSPSTSLRRPRSAGQDAQPEPPRAPTRKLGSKHSFMNLFRKGLTLVSTHPNRHITIHHHLLLHRHHLPHTRYNPAPIVTSIGSSTSP
jgi:hypothetical protein